jgi:hypothetical protein
MDDFDDESFTLSTGFFQVNKFVRICNIHEFQTFVANTYSKDIQPTLQIIESRVTPAAGIVRLRLSDGLFSYSNCAASLEIGEQIDNDGFRDSHGVINVTQFVRTMTG